MSKFRNIVESLLMERLFPEMPNDVYEDLLKDTSINGKANAYTKFFGKYLLKNRLHKDEDIANLTKRHNKLYQAGLVKPIEEYKDIFELIRDLSDKNDYTTNSERNREIKSKAKIIDEVDGFKLHEITSYNASKKYGAGTKWCTASRIGREYYDNHKTRKFDTGWDKLIYAINDKDEKYAITIGRVSCDSFFGSNLSIYDALDNCVANFLVQGNKRFDFEKEKYYIEYNDIYNFNIIIDDSNRELLNDFMQWAIKKYKLSKEDMETEWLKNNTLESKAA